MKQYRYFLLLLIMLFAVPQLALATTYQNVTEVFYDFSWDWIKLQVRSCQQSNCSDGSWTGPDNTSNTWFTNSLYNNLTGTNLADSRYFQWKAFFITTDNTRTPKLREVTVGFVSNYTVSGIAGRDQGFQLGADRHSRDFFFFINSMPEQYLKTTSDIPANTWTHVVAAYDANGGENNLKIYVNGVLNASATKTSAASPVSSFLIGNFNGQLFNGAIDEVRIYNRALSPDETVIMKLII